MTVYLINGSSTSGKTTIAHALEAKGYKVVHTDQEFGYYANLATEEEVEFPGKDVTPEWYEQNGWIWNRKRVETVFELASEPTFFCGGSSNESIYYPRFGKIFRLVTNEATLLKRLRARANDEHTNNPEFIEKMRTFCKTARADGEELGMIIIDTSASSVDESATEILSHISQSDL